MHDLNYIMYYYNSKYSLYLELDNSYLNYIMYYYKITKIYEELWEETFKLHNVLLQ